MTPFTVLRPYYYGQRKWDNYLLDIEEAVQTNTAQASQVKKEALQVAQAQAAELRQQTAALQNIQDTLQTGFDEMRAEFNWGFSLIVDRMERQIELVARIAAKLDEIHKTLLSPLMTQARELFQVGQQRLSKGLLDKAIDAFLQSEQKNEVDFLLQLQMGKLYLYGRDEDDNVVNLPEAERHLLLAARYADAEKNTIPDWSEYCAQAYFHAAVTAYLLGEQERTSGNSDGMRTCLGRALQYLARATSLWPKFLESIYTRAKCQALLGQGQEVRRELEVLADRDRRYFAKVIQDKDFDGCRGDVDDVFREATVSPGPFARAVQAKLDKAFEALEWAKRSRPESPEDLSKLETSERSLSEAKRAIGGLGVDLVGTDAQLGKIIQVLTSIADRSYQVRMTAAQANINLLESGKKSSDGAIKRLTEQRKQAQGNWGRFWGFGFLWYLISGVVLMGIFEAAGVSNENRPVAAFIGMGIGVIGGGRRLQEISPCYCQTTGSANGSGGG